MVLQSMVASQFVGSVSGLALRRGEVSRLTAFSDVLSGVGACCLSLFRSASLFHLPVALKHAFSALTGTIMPVGVRWRVLMSLRAMRLPRMERRRRLTTQDVLLVGDCLQVEGVTATAVRALAAEDAAGPVVAGMVDGHIWRDGAVEEFVGRPVGGLMALEITVTLATNGALPRPAGKEAARAIHELPKPTNADQPHALIIAQR